MAKIIIALATALTFSCSSMEKKVSSPMVSSSPDDFTTSSFIDPRDSQEYNTVKIGKQWWMAKNMNYAADVSKCYEDNSANCDKYGRLYDWATAKTVCPSGWRLPSFEEDWFIIMNFVQTDNGENFPLEGAFIVGKYLKATNGWQDGNGEDKYGFAALPGGEVNSNGDFGSAGDFGLWWSSSESEHDSSRAVFIGMRGRNEDVAFHGDFKNCLHSVRCVKD